MNTRDLLDSPILDPHDTDTAAALAYLRRRDALDVAEALGLVVAE